MRDGFLKGKTALVTGAARNLGRGFAEMLASHGAAVAIHCHGEKARPDAEQTLSLVKNAGVEAELVTADLSQIEEIRTMFDQILARFGRLDVLFNNAGFNKPLPFLDVDENNFNSIMRVNAWGVMVGTQEGAKQMIAQGGGGKIINTASIAGRQGYAEFAPYCCSKASVISLTQAGAREFDGKSVVQLRHGAVVEAQYRHDAVLEAALRHAALLRERDGFHRFSRKNETQRIRIVDGDVQDDPGPG